MERNEHFGEFGFDIFTEWHEFEVMTTTGSYLADLSVYSVREIPICIDVSSFKNGEEVEFLGKTHEISTTTVNWVGAGDFTCWQLHYVAIHERHYYDKSLGILVYSITGGSEWDHEIHLESSNMDDLRTFSPASLSPITAFLLTMITIELGVICLLYLRRGK
jgi:hypothetical protein